MSRIIGDVFQILDGRVGIATTNPVYKLDVYGDINYTGTLYQNGAPSAAGGGGGSSVWSSNGAKIYYNAGNVGIGSGNPAYKLDVDGPTYISGPLTVNNTIITNNNNIDSGSGTVTAAVFSGTATQVSQDLIRGSYLTGANYNGSVATTWAVDADSANTANKVVVRDASGNFSAGTITANALNGATITDSTSTTSSSIAASATAVKSAYDLANAALPQTGGTVTGSVVILANLTTSNLTVMGDTTILNTISSNTEQMVINNAGTGPALKVTQSGNYPIAEFYDNESGLAMTIANNGNIGIGTTVTRTQLDIIGNILLSGNIGMGTNLSTTKFHMYAPGNTQDYFRIDTGAGGIYGVSGPFLVDRFGNVGIGLDTPTAALHVNGGVQGGGKSAAIFQPGKADGIVLQIKGFSASQTGNLLEVYRDKSSSTPNLIIDGTDTNLGIGTTVARQKLDIIGNALISGNVTAGSFLGTATQVSSTLTRGSYLTGNNYNGSVATTWAVDADSANTASKVVARDSSGNFSAGTITATLNGTATQVSSTLVRGAYLTGTNFNGSTSTTWAASASTAYNAGGVLAARDGIGYLYASGVGIGTTTARQLLDIQGGHAIISGNLGIGTTNPVVALAIGSGGADITSTLMFNSGDTATNIDKLYWTYVKNGSRIGHSEGWNVNHYAGQSNASVAPSNGNFHFFTGGPDYNERFTILNNGNLGVGSTQPAYRLDVAGNAFINGTITTNNNINAGTGTITATTFSGTATQVSQNLTRGTYLTGNNYNGSVATTWAVDADSANTASKVVARDSSGNFSAGTITATLNGTATQVSSTLTRGSYLTGSDFTGASSTTWAVDATTTATANKIVARDASGNIYAANIGIGTDLPQSSLHVIGDIRSSQTIYASNLQVTGLTIQDTITSNTQQLTIVNEGSGPALIVKQTGVNYIAEFYHNDDVILALADGGLIGINTATPRAPLDIIGDTILTGNIGFGTTQALARLYVRHFDTGTDDIFRVDNTNTNSTSLIVDHNGNVGIGTSQPKYSLDVYGNAKFTGSITSGSFLGTATQVSSTLTRGSYLTGSDFTGASPTTWAVDATTTATANKVVARDASAYLYASGVGIGTTNATSALHVVGNVFTTGTVTASNISVIGDFVTMNTITSNTEQMIITNEGTGPALKVTQTGPHPIAEFYDDNGAIAFKVANDGLIGIGTTTPRQLLDVQGGHAIISGNVGINIIYPQYQLDVNGTIQTSNLKVLGTVEYTSPQNTYLQVSPVRKIFYVESPSQSIFDLTTSGIYGGEASNAQVFVGQSLLSYYNSNITDYTLNVTYNGTNTIYTVTLTNAVDYASLVDITIWPTVLPTSIKPGSVYQSVNVTNQWQPGNGSDIYYYTSGNVGIGTTNPTQKLYVDGNVFTTGTITASNISVIGEFVTMNTITSNTEQMVITNNGTGPALKVTQTGINSIAEFYDDGGAIAFKVANDGLIGIGTTAPRQLLDVQEGNIIVSGNIGIGTTAPQQKLDVNGSVLLANNSAIKAKKNDGTVTNLLSIDSGNTVRINCPGIALYVNPDSSAATEINYNTSTDIRFWYGLNQIMVINNTGVGIGTTNPLAKLHIGAGTSTVAPLRLTSGTILTSTVAGSIEYDGSRFYGTVSATNAPDERGYIPSTQVFRLSADGSAIGPAIANFFGATSGVKLGANALYEFEAYCYFTKTTAGTVTVTLSFSSTYNNPQNLNAILQYGAAAGGTATGAANQISIIAAGSAGGGAGANIAFGASASLTTAVNHAFLIRSIIDTANGYAELTLKFTSSAGTVTPLRGSYYKVTRIPTTNIGSFV